jgi:hypothetical protein
VLYECVTGTKPFRGLRPGRRRFCGATSYEAMHAAVHGKVPPPSALEPSLSEGFDRVVLRAMGREPLERFDSVDQLAEALLPFASETMAERWQGELKGLGRFRIAKPDPEREGTANISVSDGLPLPGRETPSRFCGDRGKAPYAHAAWKVSRYPLTWPEWPPASIWSSV